MGLYSVVLVPEREEGGYSVKVPLLPGCVTQGDTVEEALANAREVIELYLEVLTEGGEPIPEEHEAVQLHHIEVTPDLGPATIKVIAEQRS
ncbi:MAG: type II toxin-antitoxin system HicB family antitoxin [Dehalococcoidia bacterium]